MKKFDFKERYKMVEKIFTNMEKDHISEYSAQCAYYTILSFIPFVILLITLIQYTNVDQQTLFDVISKIIPSSMNEFILGIVREVYSKSIGTISVSIIFTIWSAGKGLFALIKGLHSVYDVKDKKRNSIIYLKLMSVIQTIIFIVIITIGLVLLVFGNSLISIIQEHFGLFKNFTTISGILAEFGFIFATFIIFLCLYKFMPKHKVTIKSQIPGAIFGAIVFNIISFVFSRYLDIFKGFSITYGSLTTLMLIMIWTYSCFYTVFLGAEINKQMNYKT
ncbi:MAG: YihY/virulence factor BrkB family protein [Clostridia bacterium]|nr:YihY/virulence factor BrkB family protein [Clostridia bacterium]